jgi:hypothetical protein
LRETSLARHSSASLPKTRNLILISTHLGEVKISKLMGGQGVLLSSDDSGYSNSIMHLGSTRKRPRSKLYDLRERDFPEESSVCAMPPSKSVVTAETKPFV